MSQQSEKKIKLEERITGIEDKVQRIQDSDRTEERLESATEDISRICYRFDRIQAKGNELDFYVRLLEEAFGEDRSDTVQNSIDSAVEEISISDEKLLTAAEGNDLSSLEDRVESATTDIDQTIGTVKDELTGIQKKWIEDLDAAEELNSIVGGESGFNELINEMRAYLTSEIWNSGKSPSNLAVKWERYRMSWQENSGKHGWETFQREHDLLDRTVEELKQFGDDDPVRLSDLSVETLEEVKRVPELEDALQLEVRRR